MKKILILASIIFLIIAASGAVYFYIINPKSAPIVTAAQGNIVQKVSLTAKVKPLYSVDLGFQVSGKVASTSVAVGDSVKAGQVLAQLDTSELEANLQQAQANRDADKATLTELRNGAKPQDIAVLQSQANGAKIDLTDSRNNLVNALIDAYTKSDDAIKNNADQLFNDPDTYNPVLNITTKDADITKSLESSRLTIKNTFYDWKTQTNSLIAGGSPTEEIQKTTLDNLNFLTSFLNQLASAVNSNTIYTNAETNAKKTLVIVARNEVSDALSKLQMAQEKYNGATSNLDISQQQLTAKKSGNTSAVIAAQAARVKQDEAQVASMQANIDKAIIISPINGIVTKQDAKIGQIVAQGVSEISVISDKNLYIEGYVPEINIGNVVIGNPVNISIEAFPDKQFTGTVTYIDPAETILGGISNFKVKITINENFDRLKSGLTADIDIITGAKSNVVTIPVSAVTNNGKSNFVSKLINNVAATAAVNLGMIGSNNYIEVISGVKKGDKILISN